MLMHTCRRKQIEDQVGKDFAGFVAFDRKVSIEE